MTPRQVLDLTMGQFWLLNGSVDRLLAELDVRALTTFNAAQSAEGAEKHREHLFEERGTTVKMNPLEAKPDDNAISTLKSLASLPVRG
jgi:hypothetical protein